ncbi:hypothetical protein lbkm_2618 [Lachnospiraceae bacterium KM106-2]|nr:hypothetical protein lbkm_2618 [Lachnospiraceae bacterium KM106-2]
MRLFEKIPDKFFTILTSKNKELFIQALFVVRKAFTTELVIKREDLVAMMIDSLEDGLIKADFTSDLEEGETIEENENLKSGSLSAKAYYVIRRLKKDGWIMVEYEQNSFEENITIPDYAIRIINVLFDLCEDRMQEYNGYVFATYSTLHSASKEHPEYLYNALKTAYKNTNDLIGELKLLFNNIQKYYQKISDELSVNDLLKAHFDEYKIQIIDAVYYPLKTIDSVPRFKNSIINILNEFLVSDEKHDAIIKQGISARYYADEEEGSRDILEKVNYIINKYEGIEEFISNIDRKHNLYTNATIDKIRYKLNSDQSIKGKLVEVLKNSGDIEILQKMEESIIAYCQSYMDEKSLYQRMKRDKRKEGKPLGIKVHRENEDMINGFIDTVKQCYSEKRVTDYILGCFPQGRIEITSKEIPLKNDEEFILLLLGTIQGYKRQVTYQVEFRSDYIYNNGYRIPDVVYRKKER